MPRLMNLKNQRGISTFWGISIILMVVVIVVFIFYILYFFWIENPTPTSNILIIRAFKDRVTHIPAEVDTTGWQTYTSDIYNFSFQHPADYKDSTEVIFYGNYEGRLISLTQDDQEIFSLRLFPVSADESIAQAVLRLTGVDPKIFQSFRQKVGGEEAYVFRRAPGQTPTDYIYFIGRGNLFELGFDELTASVLSTFTFL